MGFGYANTLGSQQDRAALQGSSATGGVTSRPGRGAGADLARAHVAGSRPDPASASGANKSCVGYSLLCESIP
jgi:hypothetical protein